MTMIQQLLEINCLAVLRHVLHYPVNSNLRLCNCPLCILSLWHFQILHNIKTTNVIICSSPFHLPISLSNHTIIDSCSGNTGTQPISEVLHIIWANAHSAKTWGKVSQSPSQLMHNTSFVTIALGRIGPDCTAQRMRKTIIAMDWNLLESQNEKYGKR